MGRFTKPPSATQLGQCPTWIAAGQLALVDGPLCRGVALSRRSMTVDSAQARQINQHEVLTLDRCWRPGQLEGTLRAAKSCSKN
jgi:hypothetical protein